MYSKTKVIAHLPLLSKILPGQPAREHPQALDRLVQRHQVTRCRPRHSSALEACIQKVLERTSFHLDEREQACLANLARDGGVRWAGHEPVAHRRCEVRREASPGECLEPAGDAEGVASEAERVKISIASSEMWTEEIILGLAATAGVSSVISSEDHKRKGSRVDEHADAVLEQSRDVEVRLVVNVHLCSRSDAAERGADGL